MIDIKDEITDEYLRELQDKHPMVLLTFDKLLKALFERNPVMYKRFLSSVLHLGLSPDEMEIVNNNTELPISEYSEYSKTIDFNTNINENILVNLELNNTYFANVKIRNRIYHIKKKVYY